MKNIDKDILIITLYFLLLATSLYIHKDYVNEVDKRLFEVENQVNLIQNIQDSEQSSINSIEEYLEEITKIILKENDND